MSRWKSISEFTVNTRHPDVHYQKGMMCNDCHNKQEMHGDGKLYKSKNDVKDRPKCLSCHQDKGNQVAHTIHKDKVSCQGCHSSANIASVIAVMPCMGQRPSPALSWG